MEMDLNSPDDVAAGGQPAVEGCEGSKSATALRTKPTSHGSDLPERPASATRSVKPIVNDVVVDRTRNLRDCREEGALGDFFGGVGEDFGSKEGRGNEGYGGANFQKVRHIFCCGVVVGVQG
jgi:hypothetical protein